MKTDGYTGGVSTQRQRTSHRLADGFSLPALLLLLCLTVFTLPAHATSLNSDTLAGLSKERSLDTSILLLTAIPVALLLLAGWGYTYFKSRKERLDTERKLRTLYTAIEQSPISVVVVDLAANIEYVNPRFSAITGYSREEVLGKNPRILQSGLTPKQTYDELWKKVTSGQVWQGELINKRKNGEIYWEDAYIAPVKQPSGEVTHFVAAKIDITERKVMEEQVQRLAQYDPLTDLPNRRLFSDRLQQALTLAERDRSILAVMFLDLDRFKPINDNYGHAMGDLVLKEVATRIQFSVRASDTLARIGGDEFVVLLPNVSSVRDVVGVAEKVRQVLNQPFTVDGHVMSLSSSAGIALYPEHGDTEQSLVRNADTAMYYAKEDGRNNVQVYQPKMSARETVSPLSHPDLPNV